jgi:uncharacterized protein YdaU (DUF1376 family)
MISGGHKRTQRAKRKTASCVFSAFFCAQRGSLLNRRAQGSQRGKAATRTLTADDTDPADKKIQQKQTKATKKNLCFLSLLLFKAF